MRLLIVGGSDARHQRRAPKTRHRGIGDITHHPGRFGDLAGAALDRVVPQQGCTPESRNHRRLRNRLDGSPGVSGRRSLAWSPSGDGLDGGGSRPGNRC
jgi:hypothetical protein